jgi:predicted MFS family arabinose efflux permease
MPSIRSNPPDGEEESLASNERTPLLVPIRPIPTNATVETSIQEAAECNTVHLKDDDAPLPYGQVVLLCLITLVGPIAFFSIFPYINFMIEETGGINKEDVGFYSGLIESVFSATQMCVMIFWGKASDRYGRKPCIVISLFGVAAATSAFGMSKTIWQMVVCRCIGGIFTGTVV